MPDKAMIFTCSGASDCGQIANAAAVKVASDGLAIMSRLAGIGSHTQKYIDGAANALKVIALDGCAVACAKKTLEHARISVGAWVCVTDFGIKKTPGEFNFNQDEVIAVVKQVKDSL